MARVVQTHNYADARSIEAQTGERHELVDGQLYCLRGGTPEHSRISVLAGRYIATRLEGCDYTEFNSDLQLSTGHQDDYVYADAVFVCGPVETHPIHTHIVTNPAMVIEVMSPTSRRRDMLLKGRIYTELPSVQAYIMVDIEAARLLAWVREGSDFSYQTDTVRVPVRDRAIELCFPSSSAESVRAALPERELP